MNEQPIGTTYRCGACYKDVLIKPSSPIECECGYRILYKKRTTQVVQFEAR